MTGLDSRTRSAKRVLIYRLGTIGDTVVALPALNLVARAFPEAERRMLTSIPPVAKASAASAVLEHTGLVHGYLRYKLRTRNLAELIKLWWSIARWRPQVLIDLSPASGIADAKRNSLFFRACGVSRQIGVPLTEDMQKPRLLSRAGSQPEGERYEYECSRLVRNIASLGSVDLDNPTSWDLKLTSAEHARAVEVLAHADKRPIIAVSFGTKNQSNDWGQARWRELLGRLAALYPTHALAICGAQVEASDAEDTASEWREKSAAPVMNLCGMLTPRESAAVFSRAVIALGHDSGPMHLAAAVQTPCVAVFSARNPAGVWFPYGKEHQVIYHHVDCEKCGLEVCVVEGKKCIYSITVDEVLGRIRSVLTDLR
jgi:heptosyltransferase-3